MSNEHNYFIDSHAHLDGPQFAEDLEAVINRALEAKVANILTIGTGVESSRRAVALTERFPCLHAAIGIDPHAAREHNLATWSEVICLARHPNVKALGETGLDFHYYKSPEEDQIRSFRAHILLAQETGLPLIIHNRESDATLLAILDEEDPTHRLSVIMHSYCGQPSFGAQCLERGFFLSLSGMITFNSLKWLADFARTIPADRLLVETDCPYLAPVPMRGRRNEPAFVVKTTEFLARLRGMAVPELQQILGANYRRLFGNPAPSPQGFHQY